MQLSPLSPSDRRTPTLAVLAVLFAIACGASSSPAVDGGALDSATSPVTARTCVPPTGVADPLIISGTINAVSGTATGPASGALVEILNDADDTVLAMTTTAANGTYSLSGLTSGGKPVLAHARITLATYAPTLFYVVDGLRTATLSTSVYAPAFHDSAATLSGVVWNHANGIVNVSVRQCNSGSPTAGLAGAVITVVPGSTTAYADATGTPAMNGTATQTTSGLAFDFNVPPGAATVNLLYQGATTSYAIKSVAGGYTFLLDFP